MSSPPTPLVLSPTSIAALPPTSVADHRGVFDYVSLFSAPETNTKDLTVGIATLPVGKGQLGTHRHPQTEVYYILQGEGVVRLDGEETGVEAGSAVFIAGGSTHGIWNRGEGELKWLYVFPTSGFGEVEYAYLEGNGVADGKEEE